jgi:hypothetical protein
MPATIERQQAEPWRRLEKSGRLVDITAESMLEEEGYPSSYVKVMEIQLISSEKRHRWLPLSASDADKTSKVLENREILRSKAFNILAPLWSIGITRISQPSYMFPNLDLRRVT